MCEAARRSRQRRVEAVRAYDRDRGFRVYDELKVSARSAVKLAIEQGRLVRDACEVCGEEAQAHHDDYGKPLDVRWLCRRHHGEIHRRVGVAA
jgi:hypothetical protein